ncbi:MAG: DoxX family protein [Planctomycetota bacterium]
MSQAKLSLASNIATGIVAIVLILAGALKLIGVGAEDMVEGLENARLIQHLHLISVTAIVCGSLLLIPPLKEFGVLMATAYWGGAIVAHLTYNDSFAMPATFLSILWLGVLLRSRWVNERFARHSSVTNVNN